MKCYINYFSTDKHKLHSQLTTSKEGVSEGDPSPSGEKKSRDRIFPYRSDREAGSTRRPQTGFKGAGGEQPPTLRKTLYSFFLETQCFQGCLADGLYLGLTDCSVCLRSLSTTSSSSLEDTSSSCFS